MQRDFATRFGLLRRLAADNLFQPATVLWRIYEIQALWSHVRFGGTVLDLGCGDGSLARVVFERCAENVSAVGLEIDPSDAELARAGGVYTRVITASATEIPEPPESFDVVFSNSTLEHLPDLDRVLREVARVLRPGGRLVATVPSHAFDTAMAESPWSFLAGGGRAYAEAIAHRLAHRQTPPLEQWHAMVHAAGFGSVETKTYFPRAAARAWEALSNLTGGLLHAVRREHPRAIQRQLGLLSLQQKIPRPVRQTVVVAALLPIIGALAMVEREDAATACGYLLDARR